MAARKKQPDDRFREIRNSKARRNYFVEETLEAGLVLTGTEIKSIRAGKAQINDAFVRIVKDVPTMYNAHIDEYGHGNRHNHNPLRPRRLLMHLREIHRLRGAVEKTGRTLIPLRIYFKGSLAKVEVGLCIGKKLYDKREDLKRRDAERETQRALSRRQ